MPAASKIAAAERGGGAGASDEVDTRGGSGSEELEEDDCDFELLE